MYWGREYLVERAQIQEGFVLSERLERHYLAVAGNWGCLEKRREWKRKEGEGGRNSKKGGGFRKRQRGEKGPSCCGSGEKSGVAQAS